MTITKYPYPYSGAHVKFKSLGKYFGGRKNIDKIRSGYFKKQKRSGGH